jgi:hypothetical protein
MYAGGLMIRQFAFFFERNPLKWGLNISLMVFVMVCVVMLLLIAASRWIAVLGGKIPLRKQT